MQELAGEFFKQLNKNCREILAASRKPEDFIFKSKNILTASGRQLAQCDTKSVTRIGTMQSRIPASESPPEQEFITENDLVAQESTGILYYKGTNKGIAYFVTKA